MPQVTLYHAPRSRSLRARWLLEEIGAPYEVRLLDLDKEVGFIFELLEKGTSSDRQRRAFEESNDLTAVVDLLVRETEEDVVT